jgi:hypothetical protein
MMERPLSKEITMLLRVPHPLRRRWFFFGAIGGEINAVDFIRLQTAENFIE